MTLSSVLSNSVFFVLSLVVHHVSGLTLVEGYVGGSVTLPCTLTPNGDLRWTRKKKVILKRADGEVLISLGPYYGDVSLVNDDDLRIDPLNTYRDGHRDFGTGKNLSCEYTGGGRQEIQLILSARITGVSIPETSDGIVTVTAGTPKTLTCSVTGEPIPPPSYNWTFDDVTVRGETSNSTTITPDISLRTVKCTAFNRYLNGSVLSEKEATATLNIQCYPIFQSQSTSLTIKKGQSNTISVPFYTNSNTPNVTVAWMKSGESTVLTSHREEPGPVRLMIRGQRVSIEGTVTALTLRDVTQSDEGDYTVTATNAIDGVIQSTQINVSVYVTVPTTSYIGAAIGGGTAAVVVIVIVVIGGLLFRKHRMKSDEANRTTDDQLTTQIQNGGQDGTVYQELAIHPDYVNATEIQQYATLGMESRQSRDYEQCDVPVNDANVVSFVVTNVPQYEDVSFSSKGEKPKYCNVENKDYVNNTSKMETSTTYYNL